MAYPHFVKLLRNAGWALVLSSMFLFLHGCQSYSKPAYSGQVVDAKDGSPIPNALIEVGYWIGGFGLIEQNSHKMAVRQARTDDEGNFYIPPFSTYIGILSWEKSVSFSILKSGYTNINMLSIDDCLSIGCDEKIYTHSKFDNLSIIISSHKIKLSKLYQ